MDVAMLAEVGNSRAQDIAEEVVERLLDGEVDHEHENEPYVRVGGPFTRIARQVMRMRFPDLPIKGLFTSTPRLTKDDKDRFYVTPVFVGTDTIDATVFVVCYKVKGYSGSHQFFATVVKPGHVGFPESVVAHPQMDNAYADEHEDED